MILGLDFGTTNTGAAVFDGRALNPLPIDPSSDTPSVCRTAMYLARDSHFFFGREAINRYFQQNLGRRTKLVKVWVGEIMQVFAELPAFYRDIYVYEDEFSPGRIFLSIKTSLRNPSYYGTAFQNRWYSASDLVATFLMEMKSRVKAALSTAVSEVVIGRPVHFSDDPAQDATAQKRLLQAAFKAGFEKVYLEYEPVAAARFYEQRLSDKKETVLVFDFGGGTLDFTVMEIGVPSERHILATGGIPIAGDVFDQRLFRDSIPKRLGEGSQLTSGREIPPYIFESLADWQEVLSLNSPENLKVLNEIKQEAIEKDKIEALIQVVTSNYALLLFDLVEQAKIRLSSWPETRLTARMDQIALEEKLTRARFERVIDQEYRAIQQRLKDTMTQSGLRPKDIDRVLRTGGSSQIPTFVRLLEDTFGPDKVLEINTFGSVTSGLAVIGHEIEMGLADYTAYTADSAATSDEASSVRTHRGVQQRIDLDSVKQKLEIARHVSADPSQLAYTLLLTLDAERGLSVTEADSFVFDDSQIEVHRAWAEDWPGIRAALLTPTGDADRILLATDTFKLILVPARSILIAYKFGGNGIRDLLRLGPGESVTAMTAWNPARSAHRFICLVTRTGQVKRFEANLLAGELRQAPYFQLEKKYKSFPACLGAGDENDHLILGTNLGRVARIPLRDMGIETFPGLHPRKGEQVTAAILAGQQAELVALGQNGQVVYFRPAMIPTAAASKSGRTWKDLVVAGFATNADVQEKQVYALTARGSVYDVAPLKIHKQPRTCQAVTLSQNDKVVALLSRAS